MGKVQDNEWMQDNIAEAKTVSWSKNSLSQIIQKENPEDDHTHCIICWCALNPKYIYQAYESSIGWLCEECFRKYIQKNKE